VIINDGDQIKEPFNQLSSTSDLSNEHWFYLEWDLWIRIITKMEGRQQFSSYLADRQAKEYESTKMHYLQQESDYYSYRIRRDLRNFIAESSIRHDCPMRSKYAQLLHRTLRKTPAPTPTPSFSTAHLPCRY
jgi:hypothetical protein